VGASPGLQRVLGQFDPAPGPPLCRSPLQCWKPLGLQIIDPSPSPMDEEGIGIQGAPSGRAIIGDHGGVQEIGPSNRVSKSSYRLLSQGIRRWRHGRGGSIAQRGRSPTCAVGSSRRRDVFFFVFFLAGRISWSAAGRFSASPGTSLRQEELQPMKWSPCPKPGARRTDLTSASNSEPVLTENFKEIGNTASIQARANSDLSAKEVLCHDVCYVLPTRN